MTLTRRHLLKLAGVSSATAAMAGALRAEGLSDAVTAAAPVAGALPYALQTPLHVGEAALRVRDPALMTLYYETMLGLSVLDRTDSRVTLGAGGTALLHLLHRPDAPLESQSAAGLFHIAFLMPKRTDLARWLVHIAMRRIPVTGFADHSVSEAVYLNDPEGNGLEVYCDRPADSWTWSGDTVTMGTHPLDIDSIVALTDTQTDSYAAAPDLLRIGHMHLRVGDIGKGRAFYESAVGLDATIGNRPDAAFLSSGRYHHHVALNVWNSRGASARNPAETGLDWFSLKVTDAELIAAQDARLRDAGFAAKSIEGGIEADDPWGTTLRLVNA